MSPRNCWDCPAEAWALLLFVLVLIVAAWAVARSGWHSRTARVVAQLALWIGILLWIVQVPFVLHWGIRLYDTANDTAVIYGQQACVVMVGATLFILLNLGGALWTSRRRT
jgi:hypothetical protein